ncbi:MAG: hypothetical protein Q9222_005936 [Ikaeria aurantiellina]
MHLPQSILFTLLSASLALASPLTLLGKRKEYLTGHAKMYVGTPTMGGELYLSLQIDPGKSDGATSVCEVRATLEYEAQKCVCTVTTGGIQNYIERLATMIPAIDDEEGSPTAGGKYPTSVDVKWVQYYFFSSGGRMSFVTESPKCVDHFDGSCATLKLTP